MLLTLARRSEALPIFECFVVSDFTPVFDEQRINFFVERVQAVLMTTVGSMKVVRAVMKFFKPVSHLFLELLIDNHVVLHDIKLSDSCHVILDLTRVHLLKLSKDCRIHFDVTLRYVDSF